MKSYGAVPLRDSSLWIYSYIHAVGRAGWPSSATPGQWITTQARRSPPGSGSRQKEMMSVKSQRTKQEQFITEVSAGFVQLFRTFCLLRRVQFFHSNRRIWEPVFIAPRLNPWRGSSDCDKPEDIQIYQYTNSDDIQSLYRYSHHYKVIDSFFSPHKKTFYCKWCSVNSSVWFWL